MSSNQNQYLRFSDKVRQNLAKSERNEYFSIGELNKHGIYMAHCSYTVNGIHGCVLSGCSLTIVNHGGFLTNP